MLASFPLDPQGRVRDWNPAAQRMFGHAADAVIGEPCAALVAQGAGAGLVARADEDGWAQGEAECVRADGTVFTAQLLITRQPGAQAHAGYSVSVFDLTDSGAARQRHLEDSTWLVSIIQSAMDAIITVDEKQRVVLFNDAAEKIFGWRADEAVGGPLDRFLPERHRAAHRAHIERFAQTGMTARRMGRQTVLAGLRADGSEFPIEASISQVIVGGRRLLTVILRDITERRQAAEQLENSHRQLQRLYAAMHEVREAERTRIARELHDELAQWLSALKMDVSWLAQRLDPGQEPFVAKLQKMKEAVDATVASVRRIAADLRPVMLDDLGLVPALENLVHEFSERTGIIATLKSDAGDMAFGEPLASAVYRMVQEALTNVARHAGAQAVEVGAAAAGGRLVVRVRDNGRGISPADLEARDSYGLLGIRERAQTLGGAARIYAAEGGGTVVDIDIPLAPYMSGVQSR